MHTIYLHSDGEDSDIAGSEHLYQNKPRRHFGFFRPPVFLIDSSDGLTVSHAKDIDGNVLFWSTYKRLPNRSCGSVKCMRLWARRKLEILHLQLKGRYQKIRARKIAFEKDHRGGLIISCLVSKPLK